MAEAELTPLEKKWEQNKKDKKPSLDDAYSDEGKIPEEGLSSSILDLIPSPTGWRIAILPYRGAKTTKGGIMLADETQKRTQLGTNVGYVLKMGDLAYSDASRFPTGP